MGGSSLNFVTRTPAEGTYDSPAVRSLYDFSRAIVNVALAGVVMWGGFNVIIKEHARSPYHEAMELLPRVILAALAANLTIEFARMLIDINNALAAGVGDVGLPGYDQATPSQEGLALIFTAIAYGIVAILLAFQMLMRLALLAMLIVLGPIAALLWVLPQTQQWTRWWTDLFVITVFQQAIQVMVLALGTALMVELTPGSVSNALLTMLLGLAVCVTLLAPLLFLMAALGGAPGIAQTPASAAALAEIPHEHLSAMQQVAAATGIPWQVLAAIAKVESGFGANMGPSSAGALGYCQFMPATWAQYGVDGDGDGVADPFNYRDCLPAAARVLRANGAPGDLRRALYAYNHSWSYVDHVLSIATSYGYLDPAGIPAQAVALARSRLGTPYVWGAAGPDSFDCSGLTQWVYAQLGIALPRTSQAQFHATMPVAPEFLQPGDLLFYENTYPSHERITTSASMPETAW